MACSRARRAASWCSTQLQQKDLRLALAAAEGLHVPLPATAVVHQLLAAVEASGGGDLGTQALAQALEALAGGRS